MVLRMPKYVSMTSSLQKSELLTLAPQPNLVVSRHCIYVWCDRKWHILKAQRIQCGFLLIPISAAGNVRSRNLNNHTCTNCTLYNVLCKHVREFYLGGWRQRDLPLIKCAHLDFRSGHCHVVLFSNISEIAITATYLSILYIYRVFGIYNVKSYVRIHIKPP